MKLYKDGKQLSPHAMRAAIAAAKKRARKRHKSLKQELARYGYSTRAPRRKKPKKQSTKKQSTKKQSTKKPSKKTKQPKPTYRPRRYKWQDFRGPIHEKQYSLKPGKSKVLQRRIRRYKDGFVAAIYEAAYFYKAPLLHKSQVTDIALGMPDWLERVKRNAEKYLQGFQEKGQPQFRLSSSFGAYLIHPETKQIKQPFKQIEMDLRDVQPEAWLDDEDIIPEKYLKEGYLIAGVRIYISPITSAQWQSKHLAQAKGN